MRIVAAIDTTESEGSVAVLAPGGALERRFAAGKGHGPHVLLALREVLEAAGTTLAGVDLWVGGAGPGSFTGVRVALSTVRAFTLAYGRPSTAVSTTRALVENAPPEARWVAPLLDARKGEVYAALYERVGDQVLERVAPLVAPAPVALAQLRARCEGEPTFVGSGCALAGVPADGDSAISALAMARLAAAYEEPLPPALPSYVRPPEAELKFGPAPAHDVLGSLIE